MNWDSLSDKISKATAEPFVIQKSSSIAGGCINTAYRLDSHNSSYFVKFNSIDNLEMFEAESEGLQALANAQAIRVPAAICTGILEQQSYLVLEYLPMAGLVDQELFAEQLAALHRYQSDETGFGWHRDNRIGSSLQINSRSDDWLEFWNQQRLGFQLQLAKQNGATNSLLDKGQRLQAELPKFFKGYIPDVSLLHGDLWSGNVAQIGTSQPVIFDPAVYYGDRETDIAMTELFGGFPEGFYRTYQQCWPLDAGYQQRKQLYNLYHILNHFNLFGGSYGHQAESMCDRLLSSSC
ncbi:MAG: fructosamine kinase family protein [Gammaproteobacteria bacterium]|nr:MAG: fructosamine kinase family protein [Gammaproteobacteria bacterium]